MATGSTSSLPFTVRAAAYADEAALGVLDRRNWSTTHAVTPAPRPPYPPFFGTSRPAQFLVAELAAPATGGTATGGAGDTAGAGDGGEVVGYLRLVPPSSLATHAHVLQIQGLVVDDRVRGHGIGRALLEAACARARSRGVRRITLRVLSHNAPARALYASVGFTVEGVLRGEFLIDGRYVDDVLMGIATDPTTPSAG